MTEDVRLLYSSGVLDSGDRKRLGLPQMMCATCKALPVTLVTVFKPFGKKLPKKLPGLTWGREVNVICPCCSYPPCPHTPAQAEQSKDASQLSGTDSKVSPNSQCSVSRGEK
jgi:hypothetical protein